MATTHIWLSRFTRLTAASTLFLIFAGGMVTSTGSGLAVPDWPLSYGMLMPPMVGGIFYEHGHRMVASFVGLLTLIQAAWIWRVEERSRVRLLALGGLVAVITQGLLGGLTVIYLLPPPVSISHACLAQFFFCVTIALACFTYPGWPGPLTKEQLLPPKHWRLAGVGAAAVYFQLILGAAMRHLGAGLAIPDFPLAFGKVIPPIESLEVGIHFAHRAWGACVLVLVLVLAVRYGLDRRLTRNERALADLAGLTVLAQVTLGAYTVWTEKAPVITSLHVANGAFLLGQLVLLTLLLRRRRGR